MSIEIMSRVWNQSNQRGTNLLLLLALADRANDDGICWPGVSNLVKRARITRRQVFNVLKELCEGGELYIARRGGNKTNVYAVLTALPPSDVLFTKNLADKFAGMVEADKMPGAIDFTKGVKPISPVGVKPVSPNTSIEPSIEPTTPTAPEKPQPKPRPQNLIFNAVASEIFDIKDVSAINGSGGRIGEVVSWLRKNEKELTPEMIVRFRRWWDETHRKPNGEPLTIPRAVKGDGKLPEYWLAFRQGAQLPKSVMPDYSRGRKG